MVKDATIVLVVRGGSNDGGGGIDSEGRWQMVVVAG